MPPTRIELVVGFQLFIQVRAHPEQLTGPLEEGLGGNGKKLGGAGRAVLIDNRRLAMLAAPAQLLVVLGKNLAQDW